MKNISNICFLIISAVTICFSQWISLKPKYSNHFSDICFPDPLHGWIVGSNGIILSTSDGGENWFEQISGVNVLLLNVSFFDSLRGWAVGTNGAKLKTINGGKDWILTTHDTSHNVRNKKVYCIDSNIVYVFRDSLDYDYYTSNLIWKTVDNGISWKYVFPDGNNWGVWSDMQFTSDKYGWMVGVTGIHTDILQILRTNDGGANFESVNINWNYKIGNRKLYSKNDFEGWVIGDSLYYTKNSGVSWKGISKFNYNTPNDLIILGDTGYFTQTIGRIVRTTDGGLSWHEQSSSPDKFLYGLSLLDNNVGWVVGSNGQIAYTKNGGFTTAKIISNQTLNRFQLFQNYPNPFNPKTTISFDIDEAGFANIVICDFLGRIVENIVSQYFEVGNHKIVWNASTYSSGVYFYELCVNKNKQVRRALIIK